MFESLSTNQYDMKRTFILVLALVAASSLFPAAAAAQFRADSLSEENPAAGKMSLKECMQYAVSNSTKVRIQKAAIGDAQIARRDAVLTAFSPEIAGSVYTYYNFGRAIDPQTNTYVNTTSFHNSYGVNASITLFDGFEAVNNLKITKTSLSMGNSREDQIEADICLATMEAYYNVVYYSQLAEAYAAQVETAKNSLEFARRQEELGLKGYADVVEMDAELAGREYDLTNALNMRNDALVTLQDVMFWPPEKKLVIDAEVSENSLDLIELPDSTEADEIAQYAMQADPQAKIALWSKDNARRDLSTARWQLAPTLALYGGWSTTYYSYPGSTTVTDPFRSQFVNNGGEYVELALSVPIYDRLAGHSKVSRKKNAYEKASAEYDQKLRDIEAEVRRAVQDRDGASAAFLQAQRKSDVQAEAFALNGKKYEQGLISSIEYRTATDSYLASKADRLNSLFKYLIKKSVVKYYKGENYIEQ